MNDEDQLARAAKILWESVETGCRENGWTPEEIDAWMRSRSPRWLLDGALGADLRNLGRLLSDSLRKVSTP